MLSSVDLETWFDKVGLPQPNFIRITDLPNMKGGLENFDNCCNILLYEAVINVGHWCILWFSKPMDCWMFFDPYSYMMDDQLKFSYHKDMDLTQEVLDLDEPYIDVNEYRYQADGTSVCGKICAVRYLYDYLGYTAQDFKEIFYDDKELEDRDFLISTVYDVLDKAPSLNVKLDNSDASDE